MATTHSDPTTAERDYATACARDRLFSPHASLAFEVLSSHDGAFEVRDRRHGRRALLKLLNTSRSNPSAEHAFLRELTILTRLDHPAIPPVLEAGRTASGELYLLLRQLRGQTLQHTLNSLQHQPWPERRSALIPLLHIAQALAYTHSQGLSHRNLRPDTIILGTFGEVALTHWSSASELHPDQPNPDLPALAHLLTTLLGTDGPQALTWVATQARQHTSSAQDVALQLQAWLADDPIPGRPEKPWDAAQRTIRKRPAAWLGAACALATLGALTALSHLRHQVARQEQTLAIARRDETAARKDAATARLALRRFREAREAAQQRLPSRAAPLLDEAVQASQHSLESLLLAAEIGASCGLTSRAIAWLEDASERFPPAYEALLRLHQLTCQGRPLTPTPALLTLLDRARSRGEENEYTLFIEGNRLRLEGQLDDALQHYDHALTRNCRLAPLYHNRGLLYRELGRLQDALQDLQRATTLDPNDPLALANRGVARQLLGDTSGAERDQRAALALDPEFVDSYVNLGVLCQLRGDDEGALALFERALALDPNSAAALSNRGIIRRARGDLAAAKADFSRAIASDPRSAEAYSNRGGILQGEGALDAALADHDQAVSLKPHLAKGHNNRGSCLLLMGRDREALQAFTQALTLEPDYALALANRAKAHQALGHPREALDDLTRALELIPEDVELWTRKADLHWRSGQRRLALAALDKAIALDPNSASAYCNRGTIYSEAGDPRAALADFDRALSLDPNLPSAYLNRANLHHAQGHHQLALADYARTLQLQPNALLAHLNRGPIYEALGDLDAALADYDKAVAIAPDSADARARRGILRQRRGDISGALRDFERFLELAPTHPGVPQLKAEMTRLRASLSAPTPQPP